MRVLVCGGRDYGKLQHEKLHLLAEMAALHAKHRFALVIEGGAAGADTGARLFGEIAGVPIQTFKADWLRYGKRAGPIRNQQMLDEGRPDMVVAFPGGAGTADMVRRARSAGIEVFLVERGQKVGA